jgi:hypothetical protein
MSDNLCPHGIENCGWCPAERHLAERLRAVHAADHDGWERFTGLLSIHLARAVLDLAALSADRAGLALVVGEVDDEQIKSLASALLAAGYMANRFFEGDDFCE